MIKIFAQSALDLLSIVGEDSVDVSIQSPPYKKTDGYSDSMMDGVAQCLYRVHKNNTLCFINFGDLIECPKRPFDVANIFGGVGFNLVQTVFWIKAIDNVGHFTPVLGNRRLNSGGEFVFIFAKGNKYQMDRLSIGIPYSDKSNIKRFKHSKDLRCRGNVWFIPYDTVNSKEEKGHPNRFPLELPMRCVLLSGIERGSLVLDCFAGSGTTGVAAADLGMDFVGFEVNKNMAELAVNRIRRGGRVAYCA